MKKLMEQFEKIMMAITFAEAGEFETSKKMLNGPVASPVDGDDQAPIKPALELS